MAKQAEFNFLIILFIRPWQDKVESSVIPKKRILDTISLNIHILYRGAINTSPYHFKIHTHVSLKFSVKEMAFNQYVLVSSPTWVS
jgi:hypothetical protein